MIRYEGDKWVLYSHDGSRRIAVFESKSDAEGYVRKLKRVRGRRNRDKPKKQSRW